MSQPSSASAPARAKRRWTWTIPSKSFTTSPLLPPVALAITRALFALYIFTIIFTSIGVEVGEHAPSLAGSQITYFTVLTYWGLGFYFLVSAAHGAVYVGRGRCLLAVWEMEGGWWTRGLVVAHTWLYASVVVFPLVVTGMFFHPYRFRVLPSLALAFRIPLHLLLAPRNLTSTTWYAHGTISQAPETPALAPQPSTKCPIFSIERHS